MYMPMEEEVRTYLFTGFLIVIFICFIYTVILWNKHKDNRYSWFFLHFLSLGLAIFILKEKIYLMPKEAQLVQF
jgi:hypothetical protein